MTPGYLAALNALVYDSMCSRIHATACGMGASDVELVVVCNNINNNRLLLNKVFTLTQEFEI